MIKKNTGQGVYKAHVFLHILAVICTKQSSLCGVVFLAEIRSDSTLGKISDRSSEKVL